MPLRGTNTPKRKNIPFSEDKMSHQRQKYTSLRHNYFSHNHKCLPYIYYWLPKRHICLPQRHNFLPQRHNFLPQRHNGLPGRQSFLPWMQNCYYHCFWLWKCASQFCLCLGTLFLSSHSLWHPGDRRVFIGGLHYNASQDEVQEYFTQFREVESTKLMFDPYTGHARGLHFLCLRR